MMNSNAEKYKKPFKVEKFKEYSGDVQQMSSPHKEAGYWLDRWAVVDAKGQRLATFDDREGAKAVAKAMNRGKK